MALKKCQNNSIDLLVRLLSFLVATDFSYYKMAHVFSPEEKFDMIKCYNLCYSNAVEAGRMYLNNYPERRQPSAKIFGRLATNLKQYGAFVKPVLSRNKPCNEERENNVLLAVTENPETSVRKIDHTTGVAKSTAHFILRKQRFHPYKFRVCQGLRPGDEERRRTFCEWYTRKCQDDENFPHTIIWSDESMVTNNGIFNRRNTHYWSRDNPRVHRMARHQHRFGFNMWVGIFGTRLIGPFFYNASLTSENYLNLLENDLEEALDNLPIAEVRNCWFQQDGAPAHNALIVREYLSDRFPRRWIGTHSTVPWPPRSPDITPLDFFLWGYIKNYVYGRVFASEDQLRQLVLEAFDSITPNMLRNVLNSTVRRSYLCLENNGYLFEHSL